jgi:hypothetical protein
LDDQLLAMPAAPVIASSNGEDEVLTIPMEEERPVPQRGGLASNLQQRDWANTKHNRCIDVETTDGCLLT